GVLSAAALLLGTNPAIIAGSALADARFLRERLELPVHLAPLAHAWIRKKVLLARFAQAAAAELLAQLVEPRPQADQRQKVRTLVCPFLVSGVRGIAAFHRSQPRILDGEGGADDEHIVQTALITRGENHAADAGVDRQA